MTSAVLNITQNKTELDSIRNRWFGSESCKYDKINASQGQGGNDSGKLSPKNFWGLFVISTAAYFTLLSVYLANKFCKGRQKARRIQPIPQENHVPAIQLGSLDSNVLRSQSHGGSNTYSPFHRVRRTYTAVASQDVHHQEWKSFNSA